MNIFFRFLNSQEEEEAVLLIGIVRAFIGISSSSCKYWLKSNAGLFKIFVSSHKFLPLLVRLNNLHQNQVISFLVFHCK